MSQNNQPESDAVKEKLHAIAQPIIEIGLIGALALGTAGKVMEMHRTRAQEAQATQAEPTWQQSEDTRATERAAEQESPSQKR